MARSVGTVGLADRVRRLRSAYDMTQADLAKRCGTSRSTIAMLENENSLPSIDLLWRLADAFNMSIDHLVGRR